MICPKRQGDVAGLGDEQRRQGQVDRGAVEVERVAGGQHQADDAALAAQPLELHQQAGQDGLAGRGAEHDQQLLAEVAQQAPQAQAVGAGEDAEDDDHEDAAGQVERRDEQAERADRLDAVLADGERHGAERAEGGQPHQVAEDREEQVREAVDAVEHRLPGPADLAQPEAAQDRQQQYRQNVSVGEGAEEGLGNDVQDELAERVRRRGLGRVRGDRRVEVRRVDVQALPGLDDQHRGEADEQRQDRQDVEQAERLPERPADLPGVGERGDPGDDRAEHDRSDHHLHDADEEVAENLEAGTEVGEEVPDRDAEDHADQHLNVEQFQCFLDQHGGCLP